MRYGIFGPAILVLVIGSGPPALGNVVSYQCGALAEVVVFDGDLDDLDAADDAVRVDFDCDVDLGADATYSAFVDGTGGDSETIGTFTFPPGGGMAAGAAPIPFADDGGPVSVLSPIRHRGELLFYLDSPGDAIFMGDGEGFDIEAALLSVAVVPEPAIR